nr:MAG TPA: hypothetical protein [Caudoviricetes sp.]
MFVRIIYNHFREVTKMVCVRLYIYYTKPPDHLWQFHAVVQSVQVLKIFLCKSTKSLHRRQEGVDKHNNDSKIRRRQDDLYGRWQNNRY